MAFGPGNSSPRAERRDPRMLQETANDGLDLDILAQARDTGTQTADAPDHEPDLNPGLRRPVERVDDVPVDEAVELGPDLRRAPGTGVPDLGLDVLHQGFAQADGRDGDLLELLRARIAGHEVEYTRGIAAQGRVLGEIAQVGVDARRDRVIVAGAEMHVAAQVVALSAVHEADLGVGLQVR